MIVIVGGGLAGCLLAYRLATLPVPPPLLLIESSPHLCGNHTWSFHQLDLDKKTFEWITPLLSHSWAHQDVRFSTTHRHFDIPYHAIRSEELARKIDTLLGHRVRLREEVEELCSDHIILKSGERIAAQAVFDARGMRPASASSCGYQKFFGLEIELEHPHDLQGPVIMDATCDQRDGFRFFYLLPWSPTRLLIEDTRYSNTPELDPTEMSEEIARYCHAKQWQIKSITRTESAALPIPFREPDSTCTVGGPLEIGLRGGYFHLTTGYSLGYAAQVAECMASHIEKDPRCDSETLKKHLEIHRRKIHHASRFFALLNRMLFKAALPERRSLIFSRFYRLSEGLIFRFYSGNLTWRDQLRILSGKPPVPILAAMRQMNPY